MFKIFVIYKEIPEDLLLREDFFLIKSIKTEMSITNGSYKLPISNNISLVATSNENLLSEFYFKEPANMSSSLNLFSLSDTVIKMLGKEKFSLSEIMYIKLME